MPWTQKLQTTIANRGDDAHYHREERPGDPTKQGRCDSGGDFPVGSVEDLYYLIRLIFLRSGGSFFSEKGLGARQKRLWWGLVLLLQALIRTLLVLH